MMKMKSLLAVAMVAGLALVGAACSQSASDLSDAELRDALVDVLTEDDSLTQTEASCVVDSLFENTDRDQLNRMADADTPEELEDGDIEVLTTALFDCI